MKNKILIPLCLTLTILLVIVTIVVATSSCKSKEHFEPVDTKAGYDSGVKVPDISATNVSILSDFDVKTPMKMYNGETKTLTLDNTTGDITSNTVNANKIMLTNFDILEMMYPVGCIYQSFENKNPKDLFGFGTWEALPDSRFLLNSTKNSGTQNGSSKIQVTNLPEHNHVATVSEKSTGSHSHKYAAAHDRRGWPMHAGATGDGSGWEKAFWRGNSGLSKDESTSSEGEHNHSVKVSISNTGGNADYWQPYITVYMWRRVADPVQSTSETEKK